MQKEELGRVNILIGEARQELDSTRRRNKKGGNSEEGRNGKEREKSWSRISEWEKVKRMKI